MAEVKAVRRRGHGDDAIYLDAAKNRYVGAVSLGYGPDGRRIRRKVTGRTRAEVRDKLRDLHKEIDSGVRSKPRYTVQDALDDWLANGLDGAATATVELYQGTIAKGLIEQLGAIKLSALTAGDVEAAFTALAAKVSTRTVQISHNVLVRAIRHAERHDLVGRNVAALVKAPKGQSGRPSKALTLEQAIALLEAANGTRLQAYIVVSLLAGLRTEEVRALRWDHVVAWAGGQWRSVGDAGFEHEQVAVFVWRSDRAGGDTKTLKSRRTLALPKRCILALREQKIRQAEDPARRRAAVGRPRPGIRLGCWHAAGSSQCPQGVPKDHRGRRARHRVGAARAAAYVRVAAVRP